MTDADLASLIKEINVLSLGPKDVLVVTLPNNDVTELGARVTTMLRRVLGHARIVVKGNEVAFDVLREEGSE